MKFKDLGSTVQRIALAAAIAFLMPAKTGARAEEAANPFAKLDHIIVIYAENLSFDGVFGQFPGADGLLQAKDAPPQVDNDGTVLAKLPPVRMKDEKSNGMTVYLPEFLDNAPFAIEDHLSVGEPTGDLVHRFYQQLEQINGGRNDRFAAVSDSGGLVMGYYKGDDLRLTALAKEFTLADHFHHAAFGGSFINHFWLVCACTPRFEEALLQEPKVVCGNNDDGSPRLIPQLVICLDPATGFLRRAADSPASAMTKGGPKWVNDTAVTPDGYAVNTLQPAYPPYADSGKPEDRQQRLPPQKAITIGDLLSKAGVSWVWYAGGWDDAVAGAIKPYHKPENFQPHHQPFNYFENFAPGTAERAARLKDEKDLLEAIRTNSLPAVSFYKPVGQHTMHPGYTDVWSGDQHIGEIIDKIRASPAWASTAIVLTVAPPKGDRWGPASRVPALVISPYARRGYVDHTVYDTTAILKTIEVRFDLPPLGTRDAASPDLRAAFDFSQAVASDGAQSAR